MGLGQDDEAIETFEAKTNVHGVADCLQQLGKLHARRRQINTGKHIVEEALQLSADIPQMQSRAACLRTLGDVLKLKGDLEGAKSAYSERFSEWNTAT